MRHYQHHIGDFNNATRHLTRIERSIYRDLIELYYDMEQPLPGDDFGRLLKRVLANTDEEKEAVRFVLDEFFTLDDDGCYHNKRCDEELEKASHYIDDANDKRENERERQRRTRARRKELFEKLREFNLVPKYDSTIEQLERMLKDACSKKEYVSSQTCHENVTDQSQVHPSIDTVNHKPITNNHKPINHKPKDITHTYYPSQQSSDEVENYSQKPEQTATDPPKAPGKPTPAASVCLAIKKMGIIDVNPSHPELLMLIEIGATVDEFVYAARAAKDKGKGFRYILGVVKGQREEALKNSGKVLHGKIPNKADRLHENNLNAVSDWVPPDMRATK